MNAPQPLKRVIDVAVAAAGLVVLAPVLLLIAGWLRVAGQASVLHAEERVGRLGRLFRIHKFRTMRVDAARQPSVAAADDPRITPPGRFLRRWRLDELPQLWDVLVGTMSLVGPRPQTRENLEAVDAASLAQLQRVRPGLTGPAAIEFLEEDEVLAQVDDPTGVYRGILVPAKVRLEVAYVQHWTLLTDLKILLLTPVRVLSPRARRRSRERVRALVARP